MMIEIVHPLAEAAGALENAKAACEVGSVQWGMILLAQNKIEAMIVMEVNGMWPLEVVDAL